VSGCIRWVRWSTGGVPRTLGGEVKSESQVVRPLWRGGGRGTEKSAKGTFFISTYHARIARGFKG
jgi:hypothetical protein